MNTDNPRGALDEVGHLAFSHPLAACAGLDTAVFFPFTSGGRQIQATNRAKNICRSGCLVMQGCLKFALTHHEDTGIWGGCSPAERLRLAEVWNGTDPVAVECDQCERGFVPLLDGYSSFNEDEEEFYICPDCRAPEVVTA